jgi:hypothetical protein
MLRAKIPNNNNGARGMIFYASFVQKNILTHLIPEE